MDKRPILRVLSLGAGVQSTTLALMAAHGEIEPMPDCAIFADTQWEPRKVYDHLDWLMTPNVLPFAVWRVTRANIRQGVVERRNTTGGRFAAIPWHTVNPDGSHGLGRRQCSSEYKLTPIMHAIRARLGKPGRAYIAPGTVEVMLGISTDEAGRMKAARQRYMTNRYPLIEARMSRWDCLRWLERHGYPEPPKSACIGCPYHDNSYWRRLRDDAPDEFADAVEVDRLLRSGNARGIGAIEFMHPQRVPLDEADLDADIDPRQGDLFGNECEGMCGRRPIHREGIAECCTAHQSFKASCGSGLRRELAPPMWSARSDTTLQSTGRTARLRSSAIRRSPKFLPNPQRRERGGSDAHPTRCLDGLG